VGRNLICVYSEICQYPSHGSGAKAAERVERGILCRNMVKSIDKRYDRSYRKVNLWKCLENFLLSC